MSSSIRNLHCRSWSRGHHACSRVFVQERQCFSFRKWWCQIRFDDPVFICWRECRFILRPARRNPKSISRGQYKLLGRLVPTSRLPRFRKPRLGSKQRMALRQGRDVPALVRSHSLLQLGPFNYDQDFWSHELAKKNISLFPLDGRRIDNIVSQFSPPSRFGRLYRPQLSQSSNVKVMLFANVTEIQTNESATEVTGVRVATLNGTNFTVSAKLVVLAAGGIENARLLLLSNQVQKMGLGNERGLVGRYFMDHPRIRWARVRLNDQLRHRQLYDATMVLMRSGYTYKDVR
jgi:choline dehydrogenase-like flavoprotein